jgi:hypothetical protein
VPAEPVPLSTPLSQLLVAFTIELDNAFERRMAETGVGRRFGISLVFWSNFLRFVGEGIAVGELPEVAGLPKAKLLSMLGGMERWRYVYLGDRSEAESLERKRDGWGSGRAIKSDWVVRPGEAGRAAQRVWPPLFDEVERRWQDRFGADEVEELQQSLRAVLEQVEIDLPEYLPIVGSANGMTAEIAHREPIGPAVERPLSGLLAQVLLAYTLEFERASELSLPLSANVVRVLDAEPIDVRVLPARGGVSKEAVYMALTALKKSGHVALDAEQVRRAKHARLTSRGIDARAATPEVHDSVEAGWKQRFGAQTLRRLRSSAEAILDQRDGARQRLALGLEPPENGWRSTKAYAEQTQAVLADPRTYLPHYPMVLHRGGWPDGS